ncbi:hypothetical protein PsYK624_014030 [Phanerochaete sordida]|uniref:DUF6533 domain-containing protein n=1 Tax=Phanerochaete sordida TaxID=48140 RepID=A0A9P3G072_9APHY|nr:hypothetical protein PsYK624_014030 [Phanerochaete sordida]
MSDSSSDDWDPSVVSQFYTSNLVQTAASALVCYEYLITITDEINVVWLRKFSPVSVLLVSTRWAILIETILELLPAAPDLQANLDSHADMCPAGDGTSGTLLCTTCFRNLGAERSAFRDRTCPRPHPACHKHLHLGEIELSLPPSPVRHLHAITQHIGRDLHLQWST